jgi:2-polyprenyl-3-methyl-5-hydroxy-6-metoxy-1,4-benzoquinol methylase
LEREYAAQYRDLYQRHWWWRSRERAILQVIRKHSGINSRERILDVGCGDGLFFDRLAEFGEVEGVEPDETQIGPHSPYRSRIQIGALGPAFRTDRRYSLVLLLDVLEHIENPQEALRQVNSFLEPAGALLLTVPAFNSLWTDHDTINHHRIRYRRASLHPLLKAAGFEVVEDEYWYQWTCPVKLVLHFWQALVRPSPKVPTVPPAWINHALYGISRLEQRTLAAGGIPFGSTLMAYCRKIV